MRVKILISYLGKRYSGFQKQVNKPTIQGEIENVLFSIFGYPISVVASGRTDAGVSALAQVAHFDLLEKTDVEKLYKRMNSMLPEDIRILSSEEVGEDFHARFSSKRKTYCYNFYISKVIIPYFDHQALFVGDRINIDAMKKGCELFVGEHNFSAFCSANTQVQNKDRIIYYAKIEKTLENSYFFEVCGNGFLYNMVRIMFGTLLQVGQGKISLDQLKEIIEKGDRSIAGKTVASKGLFLKCVDYDN